MKQWKWLVVGMLGCALTLTAACGPKQQKTVASDSPEPQDLLLGSFNADSAYSYVDRQVSFGPRVPGTPGHAACRDYIVEKLRAAGADTLYLQNATVTAFNGDRLPITNIMASFNTTTASTRRILLVAHWDTRPWADREKDSTLRRQPIDGANDGGSGTGVLLEIARNLGKQRAAVSVDILFVDGEDYGDDTGFGGDENSWCLGTQYWVENMPYGDSLPAYGILLDMVGGRGAKFHYEYFSQANAPTPTIKVWGEAERLGFNDVFVRSLGGAVTDDHVFINRAGIPTTDIIETLNDQTQSFNPTWHTLDDNMSNIDRSTLNAVGCTVLNVVYKEKAF